MSTISCLDPNFFYIGRLPKEVREGHAAVVRKNRRILISCLWSVKKADKIGSGHMLGFTERQNGVIEEVCGWI